MGILTKFKLGAAATVAAVCLANAASAENIVIRVTHAFGETSDLYQLSAIPLAERVKQLTDGQVTLELYPAGVIAPSFEAYDAVIDGTADATQSAATSIVNRDPTNALLTVIPGGMSIEPMFQWMWHGGGKELMAQFRRETMGLHAFPCGMGATELFAHSHKPLQKVEDFQGVKFRTSGAFADILTEMGAVPTVVPGSEVYTMLERQAIDATEWSGPSENIKAGLHEVAKYIIYPGVHTKAFFQEFAMDAGKWDAIPENLQGKIEAACELASLDMMMAFDAKDRAAWQVLKDGKNEIIRLDDATVEHIRELGRKWVYDRVAEEEEKGNPWMKRIAGSYYTFYDDWMENTPYRAIDYRP